MVRFEGREFEPWAWGGGAWGTSGFMLLNVVFIHVFVSMYCLFSHVLLMLTIAILWDYCILILLEVVCTFKFLIKINQSMTEKCIMSFYSPDYNTVC